MIDYETLRNAHFTRRAALVDDMISKSEYVSISDAMVNREHGGNLVLQALDFETKNGGYYKDGIIVPEGRKFKLRVLCDEHGDALKTGDKVQWKQSLRNRVRDAKSGPSGRVMSTREQAAAVRRGDSQKLVDVRERTLDKSGCIECNYQEASTLLSEFGVYYASQQPISKRKQFSSSDNPTCYWRYEEVIPSAPKSKEA